MSKRIPVHLVTGFLGSGKTSLLLDQLRQRQDQERCAVLVNDFGEARIDATLLGGRVAIQEIAGGCVCCTAPADLVPALDALLQDPDLDRVFIEATGLARPSDILDTLSRSTLKERIFLAPVVAVLDPRRLVGMAPPLLLEQMDASDVLVCNWSDASDLQARDSLQTHTLSHFPPWLAVVEATQGSVSTDLFDLRREGPSIRTRKVTPSTQGYAAASQTWSPSTVFDLKALKEVLDASGAERIKGIFHTDLGWTVLQRAGGTVSSGATGLRSVSAVDVIVKGSIDQGKGLLQAIDAARYHADPQSIGQLTLSDGQGYSAALNRWSLAALPGQVADVSILLPKRQGAGVFLSEIVKLLNPDLQAEVMLVASDGMVSGPTAVSELGRAVVVYLLDGGELPANKGGPFRILVPEGESACANVKGLARIELVES
ncbi:MAG: G3E family GTPase [Cognaticolwellia sp.]|jgi:G3E family GTPase